MSIVGKNKFITLVVFSITLTFSIVMAVKYYRSLGSPISDIISVEQPKYGKGAHVLLPNLVDARVVVPDRPHDPFELKEGADQSKIKRLREFKVSTNSLGFRGPDFQSSSTKKRILCIGDSVTFGWGVSDSESYPALLSKKLNIDVINAGVPSRKPAQMASWAAENVRKLRPNIVIVAARPNRGIPNPERAFSHAIQRMQRAVQPASLGIILPPISTFDPLGMQVQKSELSLMKRILPKTPVLDLTPVFHKNMPLHGVKLLQSNGEQQAIDRSNGKILARGKTPPQRPGSPSLSPEIINLFEENPNIKEPLFFDGGHPDAEGFQLFTVEVIRWLKDLNWI